LGGVNPTALEVTPDGRLFLCIKSGTIRVYKNDAWLATPLLTLDADYNEERGLLGIALDPNWQTSPYVYVYYTAKTPAVHNRISRFLVTGDVAGPENVLLDLNNSIALRAGGWHNGGSIHFARDGKLLIAAGNNTNNTYSQSLNALLGKILRINPDGSIPTDNPFYTETTGNNRAIYALGLRNPYTAAVHPTTGRYLINDVGEGSYEEINEGVPGVNYGWPNVEGNANTPPPGLNQPYGNPVSFYGRSNGCAITGGDFYHPSFNGFGSAYLDLYFFSDYCGGWIKSMNPANGNAITTFATGINRPIYLKTGPDGSLYYVNRGVRASGVGSGSAEDNMTTNDGGLFRIRGPVVPIFRGNVRMEILAPQLSSGWLEIELYDFTGKKVWSFRKAAADPVDRIRVPAAFTHGLFHLKFL
jgi:glucose/arabinose dehydrogenase